MSGIIITVAQQKGGSGKTTLVSHLAVACALEHGQQVAIVDVDPQGSLGEWFERREQRLGEDGTRLVFRTASGWGARREATALARDYGVVLLDTPPHADSETRKSIEAASLVVVPVQPTPADLWATQATLELAERERVAATLVLNRVPARARLTATITEELGHLNADFSRARLANRVAYAESLGAGSTVLEMRPSGPAAAEVRALSSELLQTLPSDPGL